MSDNEKLEDFLLCILESQEFDKVSYIFFNIRKSPLDYITRKRHIEIEPFMKPLHGYIKENLINLEPRRERSFTSRRSTIPADTTSETSVKPLREKSSPLACSVVIPIISRPCFCAYASKLLC